MEPIRVIRGSADTKIWHAVVVEGQGFGGLNGRIVTVRIGSADRPPERLGSGQVRIENEAFSIRLPEVMEDSLYKRKYVHIDADGDGTCTAADLMFGDAAFAAGVPPMDVVLRLTPTSTQVPRNTVTTESVCEAVRNWPLQ